MVNDYRKYFQLVGAEASEINGKLKPLLTSFANAFNTENVEQYYAVLKQIVDLTTRMSKESAPKNVNELIGATKAQVTDGSKVYIDSKTRGDLKNMINDARELRSILNSVFGGGKWTFDSKKGGVPFDTLVSPELLNRCNGLADCITNVHSQIIALKGERVPLFEGMSNAQIQSTIELYTQELLKLGLTTKAMDNNWVDITNGINTSTQAMSSNATQMANVQQVYANTSSTLQQVKQDYAQLYGVQSKDVSAVWNRDSQDNIKGFTVEVTKAKGIVESFKYELDTLSNSMQYIYKGGRGSDKGVANVEQGLEKLKTKYASFLSSNNSILSGLSQPIKDFETTLNSVGNSSSLKHAEAMFERLKQSASEISRYLSPTNSSFNKNDNAINHYRNMDNILKEMSSTFNNLVIKPEMLKSELDGVKSKISELQNLEKTEGGTTSVWAKKYADVNLELERVRQNILMAAKAESASQKASKDSAYQTQLHYLDRVKDKTNEIISLKKKMVSAGIQESNLYNDEIIKKEKLIQYDIKQLAKKELLTDEAKALLNVYKQQREIQDKINSGKYNSKTQSGIATQINSLTNLRNSAIFKNNISNNEVVVAKNQINDLILKYEQFKTLLNDTHDVKTLYKLKSQFNDLEIETQEATSAIRGLQNTLREQNIADNVATRATKLMTQIRKLKSDNPLLMNGVYRSSGKTYRDELDGMLEALKKCTDTKTYNKIRQNFASVEDSMKQTGKTGKGMFTSLLTNVKKFLGWMGMTTIVMRFVRSLKSMVSTVIELDTALTDLKKTFTGTEQDLNAFYSSANATAKELGVSTKEIIEQASAWSRLNIIGLLYGDI
jgi:hypothetical protein